MNDGKRILPVWQRPSPTYTEGEGRSGEPGRPDKKIIGK